MFTLSNLPPSVVHEVFAELCATLPPPRTNADEARASASILIAAGHGTVGRCSGVRGRRTREPVASGGAARPNGGRCPRSGTAHAGAATQPKPGRRPRFRTRSAIRCVRQGRGVYFGGTGRCRADPLRSRFDRGEHGAHLQPCPSDPAVIEALINGTGEVLGTLDDVGGERAAAD